MLSFVRAVARTVRLLGPGGRKKWALLVLLALAGTAFEAVGASLVYVLIRLISGGQADFPLPVVGDLSVLLPEMPLRTLQLTVAGLVGAFFIVRSAVIIGQHYIQVRMVHRAGAELSSRLLRGYLALPYLTHTQINSSELVRNAYDSVLSLIREVMKPAVEVITEFILVSGFVVVLVAVAPQATMITLALLFPLVMILQGFVQPRVKRLGRSSQMARQGTLQAMQQALDGVRDIRLLGREKEFTSAFTGQRRFMARSIYVKTVLSELPKSIIETGLVIAIVVVFVVAVIAGDDLDSIAATLGVFAYAGLRLQPSLRKIVQGLNHVRFGAAVIDDLIADQERGDAALAAQQVRGRPDGGTRKLQQAIELRDVEFAYAPGAPPALHNIDLTIRRGEFIGICGPTGGGKSTLIDLIVGLLQPTRGAVLVDGRPLEEHPAWWYAELGVVSQNVYLIDDTIRRNIAFGHDDGEIDEARLQRCIERAQLQTVIETLPQGLDTVVGERGIRLSGGQRQRIAIARALYREPSVIIFDEGTAALDTATEAALVAAVDELKAGRTLISVAHRISTVRHADRIVIVQGGRIVSTGNFDELLDESELFRTFAR